MTEFPPIPDDNRILFFRRDRASFGFLSHFATSRVEVDGEVWSTVEHAYQSRKSLDARYRDAVRACATPGEAKHRAAVPGPGRRDRGSWFAAHGAQPRPDWPDVKLDLMRRADAAKYVQNPELADRLLATGDADIQEDAPHDAFWGTGRDGAGQNWAGRIIMEVRAALLSARWAWAALAHG